MIKSKNEWLFIKLNRFFDVDYEGFIISHIYNLTS